MGWRGRMVLAPFAGLATFSAVFVIALACSWFIAGRVGLIGICGPVPGSPTWLEIPLVSFPPIAATVAGYSAFERLASYVEPG